MKKIKSFFRWTIFKKTFILMLVGFMLVNIVNICLDFYYTKERVMSSMSDYIDSESMLKLSSDFSASYHQLDNEEFLERVNVLTNEYYSDSEVSSGRIESLLLDKKFNIINLQKNKEYCLSFYDDELIDVHFSEYHIKNDILSKVEEVIKEYSNQNKEIPIEYSISQENKITYLSIDNINIIEGNQADTKMTALVFFYSDNITYNIDFFDYAPSACLFSSKETRECVVNQAKLDKNNLIVYDEDGKTHLYGYGNSFQNDKDICYYKLVPLLKEGISYSLTNSYDESDIEGYIVTYVCNVGAITRIREDVIQSKWLVYVSSFVIILFVCFMISFIFSRRIKRIEVETKKIANNNFDVKLKEKPKDELGHLSHSINMMSQQLKKTIYDLNEEIERVKKLESVRQEFIANFTHEIKTPLGIINGYIELIEETDDKTKQEQYLEAIDQETSKINELVLAMLNLSKLESGKVELNREEVNLDDIVASTIDSMILLIQKKEIEIVINSQQSLVKVDPFQFQIVIKNFLSNAIKHTPENGHIYMTYNDKMFSIENEGSSLTTQQIKTIWETYVSSDREGTGLGLAICKSILDLHGFGYEVMNTDKGVCFMIKIKD